MARRPNILFLIADDHRGGDCDALAETPHLDALAARGVCFSRAYTMGGLSPAVCIPSRAALHTGVNVLRATPNASHSDYEAAKTLDPRLPTLGETFRAAGYRTHLVGKWHNDTASLNRGFGSGAEIFLGGMGDQWNVSLNDYDPTGRYPREARHTGQKHSTELFRDAACEFLRGYGGDDPFLLYVGFTSPHDPRTAPPAFHARYDPSRIPLPPNFLPEHPFDNGELRIRDEMLAPFPRTPDIVRRHLADYYAMITHMDAEIGRILEVLSQAGHGDDTIVVYTSDHGLALGQHGLMGKQNLYEHSVRIPMLVSGPGFSSGERAEGLRYLFDLFPMLCESCGVPTPETVEARTGPRGEVVSIYADVQRMVTDGRWKLIRYSRSAARQAGEDRVQLYDLKRDPWETLDLADDPALFARRKALIARLEASL